MPSHSFTKTQRVRRRGEFQQVFKSGYRVGSRYFTLLFTPAHGPATRLGIVASKKLGDAVHRNRAKRLIREIFRHNQALPGTRPVDVIVIPRRELFDVPYSELDRDFRTAWRRGSTRVPPSTTDAC
ncbi:MAG: ribonuclease P protein component [Vicinamibacterales bacterium]